MCSHCIVGNPLTRAMKDTLVANAGNQVGDVENIRGKADTIRDFGIHPALVRQHLLHSNTLLSPGTKFGNHLGYRSDQ